jgi:ABC-type Mn2+/Zn2+ transport system permease subunit
MIRYYLGPLLGFALAMLLHMSMNYMGYQIRLSFNPFLGGLLAGLIIGFIVYFMPETEGEKDD